MSLSSTNRAAVTFGVLLLANSALLASTSAATVFHYANVVLHMLLGLAAPAALWLLARRVFGRWGAAGVVAAGGSLLAVGAGLYLAWVGGGLQHQMARDVHAALGAASAVLVALWVLVAGGRAVDRMPRTVAMAAVVIVVVTILGVVAAKADAQRRWNAAYTIVNPDLPPDTMEAEGAGAASPFFPSSANTSANGVIPAGFFMTSRECGRCHREIYEQWNSSSHHFSSFNNQWYRKSIEYMQDVAGVVPSKWCAGCHDHAMFFNGRFDRPVKEQIETPEAQAGLGCTSCHAITHVGGTMGQGGFTVEHPPLHDLATSSNPLLVKAHDALLHLSPAPHRKTFLKPFHTEQPAQFCSTCHKVHLDKPVNSYRWFRGFNDYDNWQASAVSGEGARSFYYPPKPSTCSDCHMPWVASSDPAARNGRVRSHRFIAANTALPFVNGDAEQLRLTQEFLRNGQISVDVFGLARVDEGLQAPAGGVARGGEPRLSSTFAVGEEGGDSGAGPSGAAPAEVVGPLGTVDAAVRRGESVRVEVVVRTRKVGHFFPGGTVDAFDVWVEFEAVDDKGRVILHSGAVADDGNGPVDPGAHMYRSLQLDGHGNPINKRNAWATRSVAYVRLIGPGSADTVHYRVRVPADAGERITFRARVKHRKFAWWNTQWAYAGERVRGAPAAAKDHDDGAWQFTADTSKVSGAMKRIPSIPITVMASSEATVAVLPKDAPLSSPRRTDPTVRERWNDYGIGLLQQGDLRNAEAAFLKVIESEPGYADGPLNVARVRLQEGDLDGAEAMLRKSLAIDGSLARTHYFLGTTLKSLGRYEEALTHLQKTVVLYPRDRVALNQLGRVLFLQRDFEQAIAVFRKVLAIDPEDLQAHYNLMLCYQGTGREALASKEEQLYLRFKADEGSQAIAGDFSRTSPEDNNERQNIHEHGR